MTPTQSPIRLARSTYLGAVVVVLATLAHIVGGGMLPGVGAVAVGSGVVIGAAYVLSRRRLSPPVIVGFLATGQLLLHELFAVGPGAGMHTAHAATTSVSAAAMSPTMLVGHAVATVLCAVVLTRAERALWVITAFVTRLLRLVVGVLRWPVLLGAPTPYAPSHPIVRLSRHDACRRGPPATLTA